ncbi:hypothetical protein, partial [Chamaesiphon sp. OTE_20_metabat_361]|uniref:hypothetical protein n=1 Tax=Chamaesiphon sp. OTE_20_metabat_361 TaxID=2964689 RepID=UPI00286CCBB9
PRHKNAAPKLGSDSRTPLFPDGSANQRRAHHGGSLQVERVKTRQRGARAEGSGGVRAISSLSL